MILVCFWTPSAPPTLANKLRSAKTRIQSVEVASSNSKVLPCTINTPVVLVVVWNALKHGVFHKDLPKNIQKMEIYWN